MTCWSKSFLNAFFWPPMSPIHNAPIQVRQPIPSLIFLPGTGCKHDQTNGWIRLCMIWQRLWTSGTAPVLVPTQSAGGHSSSASWLVRSTSPHCFAVTGIQGSSVVLTCSRWYPSQPGFMHRFSADPVKVSELWNH